MGAIPVIVPGKFAARRNRSGKVTGYKLQHWHDGRNETRHVPAGLVSQVEAGTEGYRRFMELSAEFVSLRAQQALSRGGSADGAKKKPTRR